jgi:hypothetical protein
MGCDIHAFAERKVNGSWVSMSINNNWGAQPFEVRSYSLFGLLAGVRNYSAVTPIAAPRGMPDTVSELVQEKFLHWSLDGHTHSWLMLSELTDFDYDQTMEDRRVTRGGDACCTADPGDGEKRTYREFLGEWYFKELERLKTLGAERIVFWFDN